MPKKTLTLTVNGRDETLSVAPRTRLLDALRRELGLTGTKEGCGTGDCGSCTVLLDGKPVNSCMLFALQAEGRAVTTVEGLENGGRLDPVQQAMVDAGGIQCGFCTPGMVMSLKALFSENAKPTEDEVRVAISSNLCRCTGYSKILEAAKSIANGSGNGKERAASGAIGSNYTRVDARDKVTGRAVYAEDVRLPRMIYGVVVRSTKAHARIVAIDTKDAENMPGVRAVVTGRDADMGYYGIDLQDQQMFALDKVRFIGEPVAAVAADTPDQAREAAGKVRIEYQDLPSVFDSETALAADAPLVHDDVNAYQHNWESDRSGNLCYQTWAGRGDVEKGFAESEIVIEGSYEAPIAHPGSIEPHCSTAAVDSSGRVTVWTTHQKPFAVGSYLSQAFRRPVSDFKVVPTHIGGGFGGKLVMCVEPYAVLLAERAGVPVQVTLTRDEEMATTTLRHPAKIHLKTGLNKDGTLIAQQAKLVFDTGAYSGDGPTTAALATLMGTGPYRFQHVDITGMAVYTNNVPCGSVRCPSGPQMAFAVEAHMDRLARAIGMDPLELRLKNAWQDGDLSPTGQKLTAVGLRDCLDAVAREIGWDRPKPPGVGRGIACNWWVSGTWGTATLIESNVDGTFRLLNGAVDMGTGGIGTSVLQMAADGLGVSPDSIQLVRGDTDTLPWDHGHGGSRIVFTVGLSAYEAALDLRQQILAEAAKHLEADVNDLDLKDDRVFLRDDPERWVPLSKVCYARHKKHGGPMIGRSAVLVEPPPVPKENNRYHPYPAFPAPSFCVHAVELSADDETGEVSVRRYVAAHDIGKAINPAAVEGQIEGGVAMGLGLALMEELREENGQILNGTFADYLLLTAEDMPPTQTILVEKSAVEGPYGAKGVGEPPTAPPTGAVANAIADLLDVDTVRYPLHPEEVDALVRAQKAS
ncbi:MAG: molybdopterin-dependent oxidoreductase [Woeseiaceae bacterium]|nr:molybdopterin-dependent oxidoreductase [Woeseiaceae bacterium]